MVVMGAVQMWLRYGPWAKEQQAVDEALAKRRAEAELERAAQEPVVTDRGSKLWNKWTAILGPLGIALGLFLVVWGLVGG